MDVITLEDFKAKAIELFGKDPIKWKFKCPRCGESQSAEDFLDAGLDKNDVEKYIGFSCIGRFIDVAEEKGCDWTLGGLFQMHDIEISDDNGKSHPHFDLAAKSLDVPVPPPPADLRGVSK